EQVGCLALEWQVADFVDDEQVVALEPAQLLLELVAVLGRLEPADPFLCGGEGDPVAVLAGLEGKRDREVGLAGAGRAEEADVGTLLDPGELPRCMTSGFSAAGCAVQSKSSSVFSAGKAAWRIRMRAPEASRAKTSASSSVSRNCSYGHSCSRASAAVCSSRSSTRGAFSFESRYGSRSPAFVVAGLTRTAPRNRRARAARPSAAPGRAVPARAAARRA